MNICWLHQHSDLGLSLFIHAIQLHKPKSIYHSKIKCFKIREYQQCADEGERNVLRNHGMKQDIVTCKT